MSQEKTRGGGGNSTHILDTGRNHAGACRLRFSGKAGDVVALRYGELLHPDGSLNPMTSAAGQIKGANKLEPCQPALAYQGDVLTLSGQGVDDWTPAWSWHGFRYVEVTAPAGVEVAASSVECYPMRTDVDVVTNFTSSDPFLAQLRQLVRNTFDSNLMSIQSDCPHRERFGYGGDPLGCGEAGLSIYDWSTFYAKRVRDYNDGQRVGKGGQLTGFTETAPYVGITDAGLVPGGGTGPIGWETYQPVTQLWLYKYYGDTQIMRESFNATYAYIRLLDTNPAGIEHGLGDWMPVQGTSTAFTGPGFLRMSYLAFANITEILGMHDLAKQYRGKITAIDARLNAAYLDNATGAYSVASVSTDDLGARGHRYPPAVASGAARASQAPAPFCGSSGTNPPPNPGDNVYETLTLTCNQSTIAAVEFAQWGMPVQSGGSSCSAWKPGNPCGLEFTTESWSDPAPPPPAPPAHVFHQKWCTCDVICFAAHTCDPPGV